MPSEFGIGHGTPDWVAGVEADVFEDFSTYTSTQDMLNDPRGIYSFTSGEEEIYLDTTTGVDETPWGTSPQCMRYDWIDQACNTVFRRRHMDHDASVLEAWFEIIMKFSSNYTPCNSSCTPCDHKLIIHQTAETGRFMWHPNQNGGTGPYPGNHQPQYGYCCSPEVTSWFAAQDSPATADASQWMDQEWHRWRIHLRNSTNVSTTDGVYEWWFDDQGPWLNQGATPDNNFLKKLEMGANKDKGQDLGTESLYWGQVKIWTSQAPSWDIGT